MKNALKTTTLALLASTALITSAVAAEKATKHHKHHKFHAPVAETAAPCDSCRDTPSTGLYFGGVAGQQKIDHKMRLDTDRTNTTFLEDHRFGLNDRNFVGGVMIGHGLEWMKMYWGIELEALFGETKAKAKLREVSGPTAATDETKSAQVKTGNMFGAALRVGKCFSGTLVYARFGVEARRFTMSATSVRANSNLSASQITNARETEAAFVPGIGFELPITSGLSARVEARESFYEGSRKYSPNTDTMLKRRKSSVSTVMLGVTYKTGLLEFNKG